MHVFGEELEDLVDVGVRPVRRQVGADLFDDRRWRLLVVRRRVGPLTAGMQRVPQGALVDQDFRTVAVLAQAEAYFFSEFQIGLKKLNRQSSADF
nr:hypothetical protein [uncultured Duganella sp.]